MLSDRHQADELPHINMTPMVDVVLCLLVFFMAATRLYDWDENEFAVNVPEVADAAPPDRGPRRPDADDRQAGQGRRRRRRPTTSPRLGHAARRRPATRYADQGVVIRGDATLNYQDLADVLSACDAAGIRNVRLPVRPRDERRSPRRQPSLGSEPTRHRTEPEGMPVMDLLQSAASRRSST